MIKSETSAKAKPNSFENSEFMRKADRFLAKMQFGLDARLGLYKKLLTYYQQGIPPYDALKKIHRRMVQRKNPLAIIIKEWLDNLDFGKKLPDVIRDWAPPSDIALIAAGEMGGNLDEALREIIELNQQQKVLRKAVRSQLIPAAAWLVILWGIIYGISSELMPLFVESTDPKLWPDSSKAYFDFGSFFKAWGIYIALAMIGIAIFLLRIFPKWVGEWRDRLDKFIPFSLYRMLEGATLLITMAAMTRSGVAPADSLNRIAVFSTPYLKDHLRRMRSSLQAGKPEGEAIDTGLLPRDIADDIADFGEANGFTRAIEELGKTIGERTAESISRTANGINMAVKMLIFGFALWTFGALGFLVLAIADNVKF